MKYSIAEFDWHSGKHWTNVGEFQHQNLCLCQGEGLVGVQFDYFPLSFDSHIHFHRFLLMAIDYSDWWVPFSTWGECLLSLVGVWNHIAVKNEVTSLIPRGCSFSTKQIFVVRLYSEEVVLSGGWVVEKVSYCHAITAKEQWGYPRLRSFVHLFVGS